MSKKNERTSNLDVDSFNEKQLPPVVSGVVEDESKPHLEITYDLTGDEVKDGLKRFQKDYGKVRKCVYTALCSAVVLINLYDMIFRGNFSGYTYLFIGVALAIIFVIWYNPIRHRKNIAKAFDLEKIEFDMRFYDDMIYIKEHEGANRILYSNPESKMIEDDDKFIVVSSKERIYVVPKRCLSDDELDKIRQYAKNFEDRYIVETLETKC